MVAQRKAADDEAQDAATRGGDEVGRALRQLARRGGDVAGAMQLVMKLRQVSRRVERFIKGEESQATDSQKLLRRSVDVA
jgi:hypothetical protein